MKLKTWSLLTSVSDEGELVNSFDDGGHVLLKVWRLDHVLQSPEHPGVHLSVPLNLVSAVGDHGAKITMIIHPLKSKGYPFCKLKSTYRNKTLLKSSRSVLPRVGCKADEVEVSFHEVENHLLPGDLLVLRGHVILPLGLDDALPKVLEARTLGLGPAHVNDAINLHKHDFGF